MKKLLLFTILLLFTCLGYAQQNKLKKIPFTKVEQKEQRSSVPSSLFANFKTPFGVEFKEVKSVRDKKKSTHTTYQQYYKGIKVEMGKVKLHKKNGVNESYNGAYFDVTGINTNPRISKQQAISIAESYFNYKSVFWLTDKGFSNEPSQSVELVILPNRRTDELNLAYAIGIGTTSPSHKMGTLYINANTGTILKFKNGILACFEDTDSKESKNRNTAKNEFTAFVEGTGFAAYSGSQTFETKLDGANYVLNDETRATGSSWNLSTQGLGTKTGIITVDIKTGTDYVNGPLYDFTDADNNWKPAEMITNDDVYAIDVHWGSQIIYDYWKNEHSWNSYNGSNSALLSIVHYDVDLTNASWGAINDNLGIMLYGDGGGSYSPLTTLDVIAHEVAHGVNNATSNLDYELESGALNEGLSDIWAMVFEEYAERVHGAPNIDYSRINDQNAGGALRSFSNPNAYGQPDTYGGTNWYDVTNCTPNGDATSSGYNDYCGVHTNSGVLNYWFWLVSQGGSGTNDLGNAFDITAIGMDDAASIVWQMQTGYLTSTSDYADARSYAIQSAIDLFGECSQQVQSVTNAFYAVGVGEAYVAVLPTITTQPENTTVEANNGTAQFTVIAENYITVSWETSNDGGDTWSSISDNDTYSGSSTITLSISNVSESNDLYYRAIVSNDCGSITSDEANLQSIAYTQIPDANFEAALEALGYDDISGDGQVPTYLIEVVTSLNVNSQSISDATGLEDFIALQELYIKSNNLTSLDVSSLSNLTKIWALNNKLTSLDLSNNPLVTDIRVENNELATVNFSTLTQLKILQINSNFLTSIDLSNNTLLQRIRLQYNNVASLDLSNNTDVTELLLNNNELTYLNVKNGNNTGIGNFKANNNTNLTCILVDDASYSTTNWTTIDAQTSFSDTFCDYTQIPDANFEAALEALGYDDISGDGQVPTTLIESITYLNISNKNISDITGIEDFTALDDFYIDNNNLTSLDLSSNSALKYIICNNNNLTSLNISSNSLLEIAVCNDNSLSNVDFSNNTLLKSINISNNPITTLDLSNNVLLNDLQANNTELTYLDLSNNSALWEVEITNTTLESLNLQNGNNTALTDIILTNNSNLTCVLVDDAAYSTTNWTDIDAQASFSATYCDYTTISDANFEAALETLGYDDISGDGQVPTDLIKGLTSLDVSNKSISDLTGIEGFVALTDLNASNNSFTTVNLSANTNLEALNLSNVSLTELDLSTLTALQELELVTNNLTVLDVTNNTNLTSLISTGNSIESYDLTNNTLLSTLVISSSATLYIDVRNGNNTNITNHAIYGNTSLCVLVDDADYSKSNWTNAQSTDIYHNNYCGYTSIPDANFEAALEVLGYDDVSGDGQVPNDLIADITTLDVSGKSITDLTGIEGFISLTEFNCSSNTLGSLDISTNTALEVLNVNACSLTSLDITNNTSITQLYAHSNFLETVDLSNAIELVEIVFYGNQLTSLDLSINTKLVTLDLFQNELTVLDISSNILLKDVYVDYNNIESLDFTNNTVLKNLTCNNNNLSYLDLRNGNNTNINAPNLTNNPSLTCVLVDDATYGTTNWTDIDTQTSFSDTYCNYTAIPDANFEAALEALGYDDISGDGQVPTMLIESLSDLDVSAKNISDLTGIQDFTILENLAISENNLTTLDLSANTYLEDLNADDNLLTSINVTNLSRLSFFNVHTNQLTELDLSTNTALSEVYVYNNSLTSLNIQNGTNVNIINFESASNPNLTCILVDAATYSTTNWTNIDAQTSFNETSCGISLTSKIYLEGASINANSGEESLMRDDLRVGDYLPTTSPYSDALTCEATVFNTTGDNAIVDWIWVELRNATDASEVIDGRSALLQRDGDIVDVDGTSNISFSQTSGDYYIAISHRNHLSIRSAATVSLTSTISSIDFTNDTSLIEGGSNAVVLLSNGKYAIVSGDYDANGQIQNSDTSSITSNLGSSGYNDADLDMNGQVQNSDINTILNNNLGKGKQF